MSPRIPFRLLAVQPDERLVRLVRDGHERAFDALVQRYRRPLLRHCRGMGLSDSRAEDAVQLTLLNAWQALAGGAEVRELRPWLYRIAHNAAVNAGRGLSERNTELAGVVSGAAGQAGEEELDHRIAVCDALADVAALPAMQRQAILLSAIQGRSNDEVAGALGVNQDAVRGLLYRARVTLRNAAALIPQPLISWVYGAGDAASTSERAAQLSAGGGGALAVTGAALKAAAIVLSAGALVGAAAIGPPHSHRSGRGHVPMSVAASAPLGAERASVVAFEPSLSAQLPARSDALARPAPYRLRAHAEPERVRHHRTAAAEHAARGRGDGTSAPGEGARGQAESDGAPAPRSTNQAGEAGEESPTRRHERGEGGGGRDRGRGASAAGQQVPAASSSPADGEASPSGAGPAAPDRSQTGAPEPPPSGEHREARASHGEG
jgi:RNA polymerase sigma factor (sigma-70 family)